MDTNFIFLSDVIADRNMQVNRMFNVDNVMRAILTTSLAYRSSYHNKRYDMISKIIRTNNSSFALRYKEVIDEELKFISKWVSQGHVSPFKHVSLQFDISLSLNAFGHLVKHQTFMPMNTMSFRYVSPDDMSFMFDDTIDYFKGMSLSGIINNTLFIDWNTSCQHSADSYASIINTLNTNDSKGTSVNEFARSVLPGSVITSTMVSPSLLTFANMMGQRMNDHAQKEIHVIVSKMFKEIYLLSPEFGDILKMLAESINEHTLKGSELVIY